MALRVVTICAAAGLGAAPAKAQTAPEVVPNPRVIESLQEDLQRVTCPGDPPGNLASLDCYYTMTMRAERFLGDGVTDQAMLGAAFFGIVAQVRKSPPEWDRDWDGLGRRIGTRYGQNLAKGATVFLVGSLMRVDPRPVTYASDPRLDYRERRGGGWARAGHAIMDWATVRQSARKGDGRRWPNLPLFAGATASGLTGNLWYPDRLTTRSETLSRIGSSLGTALFNSFYNEFQPEIGRVLGRIVRRGADRPRTRERAGEGPQ